MNQCNSYVRQIESLNKEIKRLNSVVKKLRSQRSTIELHLYNTMEKNHIEEVGKYKLEKLKPKEKVKRKSKKQQKKEAISLFYEIGVPDPETIYEELERRKKN